MSDAKNMFQELETEIIERYSKIKNGLSIHQAMDKLISELENENRSDLKKFHLEVFKNDLGDVMYIVKYILIKNSAELFTK